MIPTSPEDEQALELAKEGVKSLLEPVTEILRDLLGPAAKEVGLAWGDSFRVWRFKRIVRFLQDVERVASEAKLKLHPVPLRFLLPIAEASSLEDDENLHIRWVALLTNAARIDFESEVLPAFPDILRQLTSEEATFLDRAYDEATVDAGRRHAEILMDNPEFKGDVSFMGIGGRLLSWVSPVMIDNLERLNLVTRIRIPLTLDNKIRNTMPSGNHLYVSELGKAFVRACRLPDRIR